MINKLEELIKTIQTLTTSCPEDIICTEYQWIQCLKLEIHELEEAFYEREFPDQLHFKPSKEDLDRHHAEEVGDVVANALQILLKSPDPKYVLAKVIAKLIRRHPHVFGDPQNLFEEYLPATTPNAAKKIWKRAKQLEKQGLLSTEPI